MEVTACLLQVWAVDLVLFYLNVGKGTVGESWSTPASFLQLGGFLLLLLGTIIYAQVGILPLQWSTCPLMRRLGGR